ncbi:hypothetical protein L0F63_002368, partial [Massospora cicadina]
KMKVDKSNVITNSNPDQSTRPTRVRAGANITIIKAGSVSIPSSSRSQVGVRNKRSVSPNSAVSTTSINSRFTQSGVGSRHVGTVGRRIGRALNPHSEVSSTCVPTRHSTTLNRNPLPPNPQAIRNFEPEPISEDDSDGLSDATLSSLTRSSNSTASSYEGERKSQSSNSGASSLVSDLSSSYAVEARVNRKILDLEISNKSLLAINQVLESKVHKQRIELDSLKRDMMK